MPLVFIHSKIFSVPITLTSKYSSGFCIDGLTPAFAARWIIISACSDEKIVFKNDLSRISAS